MICICTTFLYDYHLLKKIMVRLDYGLPSILQPDFSFSLDYIFWTYHHTNLILFTGCLKFQWMDVSFFSQSAPSWCTFICEYLCSTWASLMAPTIKRLPATWETRVWFLGRESPLEKEMAIHSGTLAWKIPWTEEPDRLQSMGSQRVGHDWATLLHLCRYFQ